MLLLGDIGLIDGLEESIGDATAPGVRITDLHGNTDGLLVDQIATHWTSLVNHFGEDELLRRLSGSRREAKDQERVLGVLASGAESSPGLAALVRQRMESDAVDMGGAPRSGRGIRTGSLPESAGLVDFLTWELGRSQESLNRVLAFAAAGFAHDPEGGIERWALSLLLQEWDVSEEDLRVSVGIAAAEHEDDQRRRSWRVPAGAIARTAQTLLFPGDEPTLARLRGFEKWFRLSAEERGQDAPLTWLEALALTFAATKAEDLPILLGRVLDPRRLEIADRAMWKFTAPLMRRLRTDQAAAGVLADSLDGRRVSEESPLFTSAGMRPEDEVTRRVFVTATALKASGHLSALSLDTALATLRDGDPRTVVVDPFLDAIGPVRTLGTWLAS